MQEIYFVLTLVNEHKMNKKVLMILSVLIIIVFIGYIIFDTIKPSGLAKKETKSSDSIEIPDAWKISTEFKVKEGSLKAVAVDPSGEIYLGGDSFVSCYDKDIKLIWTIKTPAPVTALCNSGDTIFASTMEQILVMSASGRILNEWGPFEDSCIITSVSSNRKFVAFADAGNKMIFILDKGGEVKKIVGQNKGEFIIPSPYFDVALDNDNNLFIANTGHHRIELRTIDGTLKSFFGEAGTAPGFFAGCCAPPHFALIPEGYVTAEKGINRIKILNKKGEFVEFVNSKNNFVKSVPLDLASADGKTIYAANPSDSKLYVFNRK
jgi:DNA-binding beta-propeller fold protein YncE